ncbi:hypothetical protein Tco_1190670, partial [Tanacetum coccineum]
SFKVILGLDFNLVPNPSDHSPSFLVVFHEPMAFSRIASMYMRWGRVEGDVFLEVNSERGEKLWGVGSLIPSRCFANSVLVGLTMLLLKG